jgi:two-component system, cell cycle sensor histidine kinase and response regulator CckA
MNPIIDVLAGRPRWQFLAGLAAVAGAIFVIDLTTPRGLVEWVLYLPMCVLVAWFGRVREAVVASLLATCLIVLGALFSPPGVPLWMAVINRAFGILAIWLAIALAIAWRRAAIQIALQTLRDADRRLADILENADDAIISIDEAQNINLFNRGGEKIFGYAAEEVIGKNLKMLLPTKAANNHEKFVREFGASDVRARRMAERGVVAGRRKDGSEFPAEVSISKISSDAGTTYTAILRDVTVNVEAEKFLRDRNRRLGLALSAGQMGMFENDETGRMAALDPTARKLLGLDAASPDLPTEAFFERIHPEDRADVEAKVRQFFAGGTDSAIEYRVVLPDGSIRWIAAHAAHEDGRQGRPGRAVGVLRDITERKNVELALEARVAERTAALREEIARREEAQAALVRSQKLQATGELAGGMAHDFNNLLTVITGNLELLGLRQLDDKARDLIRRAEEAAKMGARLAGRLLAIGRRQRLRPVNLDLNDVARSLIDVLKRTLGDEIEIKMSLADGLWPAVADLSEVENAILNIAINARDAMPHGGKLMIETDNRSLGPYDVVGEDGLKPGEYVLLSMGDTGVGIPQHLMGRVFEPFFTTKESGRGTGLGLSTIYGFAKQSGGHLAIYSEVGKGTTVRLYLPRAAAGAMPAGVVSSSELEKAATGETVLVVEDNADVREVTVKRLDMLGYRVIVAENGPAALQVLTSAEKIDLLFSDVMMPGGMSGFDLIRWVRANKPSIRTLLTSGFTGEVAKNGNSDLADVEVLRKPYAIAELARAVREALS